MERIYVGIDVAKQHVDVHVRPTDESFRVSRDDAGLGELVARLRCLTPTLVVLEATGGYEIAVAATLGGAGLPVAVVNPRQIRDFARATGQLAKTDALDARNIARFAEAVQPVARPLPTAQAQALAELVARRRQLVEMLGAETTRHQQAREPRVQRRIATHLRWLTKALAELERDLDDTLRASRWGARRTTCSSPCPASAMSRPSRSSPISRSWATWIGARLPPSSASRRSTGIAEPCGAAA